MPLAVCTKGEQVQPTMAFFNAACSGTQSSLPVFCCTSLDEVATLHLGPGAILVALTLSFRRDSTTDIIEDAIRDVTEALQEADERVVYVYVRPSERVANPDRKEREPPRQAKMHLIEVWSCPALALWVEAG